MLRGFEMEADRISGDPELCGVLCGCALKAAQPFVCKNCQHSEHSDAAQRVLLALLTGRNCCTVWGMFW